MHKIAPCLWFDSQAMEASNFYVDAFKNGKIENVSYYPEGSRMPSGTVLTVRFTLNGQEFDALNGGPIFSPTPAISYTVNCESVEQLDELWDKLSDRGIVLMELGSYPFSERFGWLNDRYGVSWQLLLGGDEQHITPSLLFVGKQHGKAEEALNFYCQVFEGSKVLGMEMHDGSNGEPVGTVRHAQFVLAGQKFTAMDSAGEHNFTFTEANSFYVYVETQDEIDDLWSKLTKGGEESQCGWLKDKFGVSWQIASKDFEDMIDCRNPERTKRVTDALFQMKKIDLATLRAAYNGE